MRRYHADMRLLTALSVLAFAMITCAFPVRADGEPTWTGRAPTPVPAGAKVALEFDRAEYGLGENVLVHFVLENASEEPFEFSTSDCLFPSPTAARPRKTGTQLVSCGTENELRLRFRLGWAAPLGFIPSEPAGTHAAP